MARLVSLWAAFAIDGATAKAGVLGGVTSLIEQRCSAGHLELRSLMSRSSVQEGDMNDVVEFLKTETAIIEDTIITDHNDALQQVENAIKAVEDADATLVKEYENAVTKDEQWQDKAAREHGLYVDLEEIEGRKKGLEDSRDTAKDDRDAIKDIDIVRQVQEFTCDMKADESCLQSLGEFVELKNGLLESLNTEREELEGNYQAAEQTYQEAEDNYTNDYEHPQFTTSGRAMDAYFGRKFGARTRETAICAAVAAHKAKCDAVAEYQTIIEGVESTDGFSTLSHLDRVNEWRVTRLALCVVQLLADGVVDIDEDALTTCEKDADFNDNYPFGETEKARDRFNAVMVVDRAAGKFNCEETSMSFHGSTWEIVNPTLTSWDAKRINSINMKFVDNYEPTFAELENEMRC